MNRVLPHRKRVILAGLMVVFLSGTGWVLASQPDPDEPVLARAGDVAVTAEVFRARYVDYLLSTGVQDQPALRKTFLGDLIASQLLIAEARKEDIEQEADYQARHEQVRRKLLVERYAQRALFDTLDVREDEVKAMFARTQTQLKARHLYARTREEADALYARLQAGETFEDLAREVFADPGLASTGGSLGYFSFDEMDPAFEDAAYALGVGEISEPVQTAQGYSIIQLEDRFTRPLLTEFEYAEKRANLRAYVLRRKRLQARHDHVRRLAEDLNLAFNETALNALLGQISGGAMIESEEALRQLLAEPLVTFGPAAQRQTWTVEAFRERAQHTSDEQRAQVRTREGLTDFVQGLVAREVMMDRARERGWDASPEFEQALAETMNEYVLKRLRERMDAEIEVPEDSARATFEAAPMGTFVHSEQVQVGEILLATKAEAEQVKAQLAYSSFETLARAHTLRPGARAAGGDLGFLNARQLGPLAETVFGAAEGAVLGPLELQGRYALFKVGPRRAEQPMTYDEARDQIVKALHHRYTRAHRRALYDDLHTRYDIDVDTALLYSMPLTHGNED